MRRYRVLYSPNALAGLRYQLGVMDDGDRELKWRDSVATFQDLRALIRTDLPHSVGHISVRNGTLEGQRRLVPEEFAVLNEMQTAHNKRHTNFLRKSEGKREKTKREKERSEAERRSEGLRSWHG